MLSDIIALVKAGFTAEQIMKLSAAAPAENPKAAPAPAPESTPEPTPAQSTSPSPDYEALMTELKSLRETVSAMQSASVKSSEQPMVKQQTVEDILQGYLNGGNE